MMPEDRCVDELPGVSAVTRLGEAVSGRAAGQQLDPAAERCHIAVEALQLIAGIFHLTVRTHASAENRLSLVLVLGLNRATGHICTAQISCQKMSNFQRSHSHNSTFPVYMDDYRKC